MPRFLHDLLATIVGGILFLVGIVLTIAGSWKPLWGNISKNLSISFPAISSGLSPILLYPFAAIIPASLRMILILGLPLLIAITLSLFTGYHFERFGNASSDSFSSKMKASIIAFLVSFSIWFLLFWMFSCGTSEYGCGTGVEKLMGFVFICPPLVIYAPLISFTIVSFNKIGYMWKYRK